MILMCAHVRESLAYRQVSRLPNFFLGLEESVGITPKVLNLTAHGNPGEHHTLPLPSALPIYYDLGCSLEAGTFENSPGDPKGTQVGNSALNTVS